MARELHRPLQARSPDLIVNQAGKQSFEECAGEGWRNTPVDPQSLIQIESNRSVLTSK
jgi:hypothetical protein